MSIELIKALLQFKYYEKHKTVLSPDFIDKTYHDLYETILKSHKDNKTDLTVDELKALHESYNPTMSMSKKNALNVLYDNLRTVTLYDERVQDTLIINKVAENLSNEIAMTALSLSEGKSDKTTYDLQLLLDKLKKLKDKPIDEEDTSLIDVEDIFSETNELKWKFNLPDLQERLSGIGPGYFGIVAARPDVGKTGFYIALTASTDGWLAQGAKVCIIGNEEAPRRIKQRIISSFTGWTKTEIIQRKEEVGELWNRLKDNVRVVDGFGMTMATLDNYVTMHPMDILIIDQLDKIGINGRYGTNEERLRAVYIQAREIAKKNACAVIGICQAGFAAHGKLYYGFECLEGSKTGKAAECDWCITLGMDIDPKVGDTGYRMANIPKNKITGKKTAVGFVLEPDISRIHP